MRKGVVFVMMLFSCRGAEEFINMDPVEIVAWQPADEGAVCGPLEAVKITFSEKMEKGITEQAFSLKRDDEAVGGFFRWEEKTMYYYPVSGIMDDSDYEIEVGTSAEDIYGNSLSENFVFRFSTKKKEHDFSVCCPNIGSGSIVSNLFSPVVLRFSSPCSRAGFYKAFSIYPSLNGKITFSSCDTEAVFIPSEKMDYDTVYTVSVSDLLTDRYGNAPADDFELVFSTVKKPLSELSSLSTGKGRELEGNGVINRGIEKDDFFKLIFSREADDPLKEIPLNISPGHSYKSSWNDSFTECDLHFDAYLPYGELLEISALGEKFLLFIDGEDSIPPEIEEVKFYQDHPSGSCVVVGYGDSLFFPTSDKSCFEFSFSLGPDSYLPDAYLFASLDFEVENGDLKIEPFKIKTSYPAPGKATVSVFCEITSGLIPSPVIITFRSSLKDSKKNSLGEDFVLRFNSL